MPDSIDKTRDILAKHHRNGEAFVELMKETYANRFGEAFWTTWDKYVAPLLEKDSVVLDLGTGPGLFLQDLVARHPGVRAVGVECAPWMLEVTKDLPDGCEVICEDLHDPHLPFEDASVDAALASVVLHEMHQPVRSLMEMQRCLKPGGLLFVLDWVRAPLQVYLENQEEPERAFNRDTPVDELEDLFIHFIEHNRFSSDDLQYLLEHTGFEIVHFEHYNNNRFVRLLGRRV
jgi:arsenite methyltransferase